MPALSNPIIGLSISETGTPFFNQTLFRIVTALRDAKMTVSFSHHWGHERVMDFIYECTHHGPYINVLAWPDHLPNLPKEQQKNSFTILKEAGTPSFKRKKLNDRNWDKNKAYLRARALTKQRLQLNALCHARLCVGGKTAHFEGRYPGIMEEALLAIKSNKPLYISGILGGAATQMALAIERKNRPQDLFRGQKTKLYRIHKRFEGGFKRELEMECSSTYAWKVFSSYGIKKLSKNNGLTIEENHRLFNTVSVNEAIELVLTGLRRLEMQNSKIFGIFPLRFNFRT